MKKLQQVRRAQRREGFAALLLVVSGVVIIGAVATFLAIREIKKPPSAEETSPVNPQASSPPPTSTAAQNLSKLKSEDFGLEITYSPQEWAAQSNLMGDVLYSREKIIARLSENANNAKYLLSWSYTAKNLEQSGLFKSECRGNYAAGDAEIAISENVTAKGCKVAIFTSGQTQPGRITEYFYLEHPITKTGIIFAGGGEEISKNSADKIFSSFEALIGSIKFYRPSARGLEAISEIKKSGLVKLREDQLKWLERKDRDGRSMSVLSGIKNALGYYHDDRNDYPSDISSLIPAYLRLAPEEWNVGPRSSYHYFRCSKDDFHLGVSLETDEGFNDAHSIGKSTPNAGKRCAGDTIGGFKNQKCSPEDSGNFCYDLGPAVPAAGQLTGIDRVSLFLQWYKFVPVNVILRSNEITGSSYQQFVRDNEKRPDFRDVSDRRITEIKRLENAVLSKLTKDDFEIVGHAYIELSFSGNVSKSGLEKLKNDPNVAGVEVSNYFEAKLRILE